ncbi:MAG: type II toxin-antitoxin system VapC family toxin [Rhodospirillaceae bacterium]|nr:type II toxin-antitoxin system VapC family toxin [Rhodospirillaceae bacterium]
MLGVDTNVLIRFLVKDDPRQTLIAETFFRKKISITNPGFINLVVLAETVWVLTRTYKYQKSVILEVIGRILNAAELVVEDAESVETALEMYRTQPIDFADALVAAHNQSQGCRTTVTFDRKLAATALAQAI